MREWKKVSKGIYLVGDVVYYRLMVNGKREMEKAPMQGALAIDTHGRPTKALRKDFEDWRYKLVNREFAEGVKGKVKPTLEDVVRMYRTSAPRQRTKTGKPSIESADLAESNFKLLVAESGLKWTDAYDKLTPAVIDRCFEGFVKNGNSKTTAWTKVMSAKGIAPRWIDSYYEEAAMDRPTFRLPPHEKVKGERYQRLEPEMKAKILEWYNTLWDRNLQWWLLATMMLHFAMRNCDVCSLTWDNFKKDSEGRTFLNYVPHKTKNSSGRRVVALVPDDLLAKIRDAADKNESGHLSRTLGDRGRVRSFCYAVNQDMRGFTGLDTYKALYELRKLCIDYYYRTKGVQAAVSISGDNISTVSYYYSDLAGVGTDTPVTAEDIL